jgi:class I fructose-bisphosphate aldolase
MFGSVKSAWNMGAAAIGATIYFGSSESNRQIVEVAEAFEEAHNLGMATILWCYLRNDAFKKQGIDYHVAADLTGQANHLGVTIQADIIKQKLPENNGGFKALIPGVVVMANWMNECILTLLLNIPLICADTRYLIVTWEELAD